MEYRAAHILVETARTRRRTSPELADGADFAALARETIDRPVGPNGGALGWFGAGRWCPNSRTRCGAGAGEVSDPVQTQFGWHVIKLNETRDKDAPRSTTVRAELPTSCARRDQARHAARRGGDRPLRQRGSIPR